MANFSVDKNSYHIFSSFQHTSRHPISRKDLKTSINIVHGNCLEKLKEIKPASIHLVVTDPPYFLDGLDAGWEKGKSDAPRNTGSVGGLPVGMKFDLKQGKRLQSFIGKIGDLLFSIMLPGAFGVFFSQPRLAHRMATGLEDAGFEIRDLLAWHFTKRAQFKAFSMDHFVDRMDKTEREKIKIKQKLRGRKTPQLRPQFEAMVLIQKPRDGTFINNWLEHETGLIDASVSLVSGFSPSSVMLVEKPNRQDYNRHLTVKPVKLIEHLIKLFSLPGQIVLDPFLGSGTTAVASINTQRSCVGIEINKNYIEIAENRVKEEKK